MKIKHKINGVDVTTSKGSLFFGIEMLLCDMNQVRAQVESISSMKERAKIYLAFASHISTMKSAVETLNEEE